MPVNDKKHACQIANLKPQWCPRIWLMRPISDAYRSRIWVRPSIRYLKMRIWIIRQWEVNFLEDYFLDRLLNFQIYLEQLLLSGWPPYRVISWIWLKQIPFANVENDGILWWRTLNTILFLWRILDFKSSYNIWGSGDSWFFQISSTADQERDERQGQSASVRIR